MHASTGKPRIVSLLPSTTEIIAALGYADCLVGRSHECDFPAGITELPVISRPRRGPVEWTEPSSDIHRRVVAMLEQVLSIYEVDPEALQVADPDLIITQDLCRVCAVAEEEVLAAARTHLRGDVQILTSSPMTLDAVFTDIKRIAQAIGDPAAGDRLVTQMRADLAELAGTVTHRERPTIALLEWADPIMAGGNWAPDLIRVAGAEPVLGNNGGHSPMISIDDLLDADPDVVLVAPCGYDLKRAVADHDVLTKLPGWERLSAVRNGRVAFADGSAYFNRPGPRLVTSAAIVAAVTHGVGTGVALQGAAWQFH